MKKIIIAMAAMAAAFTMASCNKEQPVSPNEKPPVGKSVITASIESGLTKTTLDGNDIDGYQVFWSEGDALFVGELDECFNFNNWIAEYTLQDSSIGNPKGIFCWQTGNTFIQLNKSCQMPSFKHGTMYVAAYPFDLFEKENYNPVWKTEQTYNSADRYIPMLSEIECTKDGEVNFMFTNLGGLLRLTVHGSATIRSIKINAAENEAMSGAFVTTNDADGKIMGETSYDLEDGFGDVFNYIILDCGEDGVRLTDAGTDFYISIPCHITYDEEDNLVVDGYSDVTITLTDIDGKTCVKKLSSDKKLVIERSKITTASFTASEFKANIPEGALPGKFTINEDGDQVYFSQGNLYYDGSVFKFESTQAGLASEWDENHVSHFYWSKTASVAYADTFSDSGADYNDVFFTNATYDTANHDFTVNGVTGQYRTLSDDEWEYLFNSHSYKWVTVNGVGGYVIAPDQITLPGEIMSYTETELNDAKLVFLPAASVRLGSIIEQTAIGENGIYWSSYANGPLTARFVYFDIKDVIVDGEERIGGCSVRLVTNCE